MKLQKIVLSAAVALATFGTGVGLFETGSYLYSAWQPLKINIPRVERLPSFNYPPPTGKVEQPIKTSEPEKYVHNEFSEWGKSGYYYIIGNPIFENNPKGFRDFEYFHLITKRVEEKSYEEVPVKPNGWFCAGITVNFARLKISGKKISFTTEKQNGVFYRMEGVFVEETITIKDEFGNDYTDTIAIKGRLTKWKNGVKIAEAEVNFGFTVGC